MLKNRVIPTLLLSGEKLVKTVRFDKPKYVGDPINAIRIFNEKEVDELVLLDIHATRKGTPPNYRLIEQIAGECFMPLCYGGGISDLEQARTLFSLGVEKVSIQTSILDDKTLITQICDQFGSQSVVAAVDVKRDWLGRRRTYGAARRASISLSWQTHLQQTVDAGAGEVLLTSVDREGTLSGLDLELIREASSLTRVPLIAAGGTGSLADIQAAIKAGASAVGVGAFFVFHGPHRAVLITYPKYSELEALLGQAGS
jgi:imidazole glycerol-phosphate synthase subunit HisF